MTSHDHVSSRLRRADTRLHNDDAGEGASKALLCHISPLVSSKLCNPAGSKQALLRTFRHYIKPDAPCHVGVSDLSVLVVHVYPAFSMSTASPIIALDKWSKQVEPKV